MSDEELKFWLIRVLQQKCVDIKNLQERISTLSHQIGNFDKMANIFQKEVIKDLIDDMVDYEWYNEVKKLKERLGDKK